MHLKKSFIGMPVAEDLIDLNDEGEVKDHFGF